MREVNQILRMQWAWHQVVPMADFDHPVDMLCMHMQQ